MKSIYKGVGTPVITYKGKLHKVKFMHEPNLLAVRSGRKTRGWSRAYINDENGKEILSADSFCSQQDQFKRQTGRAISAGRLQAKALKISMEE